MQVFLSFKYGNSMQRCSAPEHTWTMVLSCHEDFPYWLPSQGMLRAIRPCPRRSNTPRRWIPNRFYRQPNIKPKWHAVRGHNPWFCGFFMFLNVSYIQVKTWMWLNVTWYINRPATRTECTDQWFHRWSPRQSRWWSANRVGSGCTVHQGCCAESLGKICLSLVLPTAFLLMQPRNLWCSCHRVVHPSPAHPPLQGNCCSQDKPNSRNIGRAQGHQRERRCANNPRRSWQPLFTTVFCRETAAQSQHLGFKFANHLSCTSAMTLIWMKLDALKAQGFEDHLPLDMRNMMWWEPIFHSPVIV